MSKSWCSRGHFASWQLVLVSACVLLATGVWFTAAVSADETANQIRRLQQLNSSQLQRLLSKVPKADLNSDGKLTREEAIEFLRKRSGASGSSRPSSQAKQQSSKLEPTYQDLAYGEHARNRIDLWIAEGDGPRPLVVFIHGGGFRGGDKSSWRKHSALEEFLNHGVSCAAVNYRFREHAPIQDILRDIARSLQTLRHRASEFNIDPDRVAGWGGSAGAGSSLWLTVRDDLAMPDSDDPVERQSSRLQAAVLTSTQATYDLTRWSEFLGEPDPAWALSPTEVPEFYHLKSLEDLNTPRAAKILSECDMLDWVSKDDGPVFISNLADDGPIRNRGHYLHHPKHADVIEQAFQNVGASYINSDATKGQVNQKAVEFVLSNLKDR